MVAEDPRDGAPSPTRRRKPEDTAEGCRTLADADRARAEELPDGHMRGSLERSAEVWGNRANMLDRLEAGSNARAAAFVRDQEELRAERAVDGRGTGSIEQGKTPAESGRGQGEDGTRPRITRLRIKGLSHIRERKDDNAD